MENKNQEQINNILKPTPEADLGPLFYNVLPKNKTGGPLTTAAAQAKTAAKAAAAITSAPAATTPAKPESAQMLKATQDANIDDLFKKPSAAEIKTSPKTNRIKQILTITGIVVLVTAFGFGGYYLFPKIFKTSPKTPANINQEPATVAVSVTTPQDWQSRFFGDNVCTTATVCGDEADPDLDGLINKDEFELDSDPNNPDSDLDGLADGDEAHIFGGDVLNKHTANNLEYTDGNDASGGYDVTRPGEKYTTDRLAQIKSKIKQFGIHQPTLTTLGDSAMSLYGIGAETDQPADVKAVELPAGIDPSPQAQGDRDSQRLVTIKKIGNGLVKYKQAKNSYPATAIFNEMVEQIKPYITTATNYADPINSGAFVYNYQPKNNNAGFSLTYYSETQKQKLTYTSETAEKNLTSQATSSNDDQRMFDLENLRIALLLYSENTINANQVYNFPAASDYPTILVPEYIDSVPQDPKTKGGYIYTVAPDKSSFTLKGTLENPSPGTTGIVCDQESCRPF